MASQPADSEVEILERRSERLDTRHPGACRDESFHEIRHPPQVVETDEGGAFAVELDPEHAIVPGERDQRGRVGRRERAPRCPASNGG